MTNLTVLNSLRSASALLSTAGNELNRPEEDVVALSACECTRNAVMNFLQAYLIEKKSPPVSKKSLRKLLSECCKTDAAFKCIDISCFFCKTLGEDSIGGYCPDIRKINECLERAKAIEEFVLAKLKVLPNTLE